MNAYSWSKGLIAASLGLSLVFTGNSLAGRGAAAESPPQTEPTGETVHTAPPTTAPVTWPTAPAWEPDFAGIAEGADGKHIFVYDAGAEEMLFCKEGEAEKLYPASITKLYAAAVALMYLSPEEVVTAGEELKRMQPGSSRAYVSRGCQLTVEMLVEAMLIPSGNDAAYVLSAAAGRAIAGDEALDGSAAVDIFIEEMNRKAEELGLVNSHFVNPDGYHDENHYMCPMDAARVAVLALRDPVIAKYAGKQQDSVTFRSGERIAWYNTNHLINPESPYFSAAALGLKTGYTDAAGQCLLAAFREDERTIIVGIFGAEKQYQRYADANTLFREAVAGP